MRGRRYPLVVTQYNSRGFLRGQLGGVYPIFPLAAAGFAVLSIDRPEDWSGQRQKQPGSDVLRDRASTYSVNERAVDQMIAEGLADPGRLALTGLSGGAETLHYTLQRTDRYAAAIADSGIHDITFFAIVPKGPRRDELMRLFLTPTVIAPEGNLIYQLAWSREPEKLKTPLLINSGSDQAMLGFEGLETSCNRVAPSRCACSRTTCTSSINRGFARGSMRTTGPG